MMRPTSLVQIVQIAEAKSRRHANRQKTLSSLCSVLPQIVPFAFGEDEINAAEMVSASCTVNKGDFPIKISWLHNSQPIYANDGVSISRTNQRISILSIESVHGRHSGTYSCMAENLAGSVNFTTSLWVNGTSVQSFSEIVQALETLEWASSFRNTAALGLSLLPYS